MIKTKQRTTISRRRRQMFEAAAKQADTVAALDRKGRPRERGGRPVLFPAGMTKA